MFFSWLDWSYEFLEEKSWRKSALLIIYQGASISVWHHSWYQSWSLGEVVFVQFSSVQLLSRAWLFVTPWATARQASLFTTNSQSLLKLMSIESVMPSNHLILCHPLLLPLSIFPSIRVYAAAVAAKSLQSCPTLCNTMDCRTPGLPVCQQLTELTQTHVHWVDDAIQLSHPLSSPSPPTFNLSQHQVFSNESVLCMRWPKYWSFSFSIIPSKEIPGLIAFRIPLCPKHLSFSPSQCQNQFVPLVEVLLAQSEGGGWHLFGVSVPHKRFSPYI